MSDRPFFAAPALGPSVVMTKVGGRTYPAKVNVRCKTCMSPHRVAIENALLKSYGYTAIVRSLPEDADLTARNIEEHYRNGHMPMDESVRRVLIEEDAKERGLDIEGYEGMLANHITLAKLGVQKVLQRFMDGELEPDLDHAIAFGNLLMKAEEKAGEGYEMESIFRGFQVYIETTRAVVSDEQFSQIIATLSANPVLRSLINRQQQAIETTATEVTE